MEAIIFIGIQGSGKSTFYKQRFFDTHIRINLDMLRTRNRESILLDACLAAKQPFVADNTNPTSADRARYIAAARAAGFRVVCYYFRPTLAQAIANNNQRSGRARIPTAAIAGTAKKLQPPMPDEGFDAIFEVGIGAGGEFTVTETGAEAS